MLTDDEEDDRITTSYWLHTPMVDEVDQEAEMVS